MRRFSPPATLTANPNFGDRDDRCSEWGNAARLVRSPLARRLTSAATSDPEFISILTGRQRNGLSVPRTEAKAPSLRANGLEMNLSPESRIGFSRDDERKT
jgi:hypothetical protein